MVNNQFKPNAQSIKILHKYLFSNQNVIMRFTSIFYVHVSGYNIPNSFISKKCQERETNPFLQVKEGWSKY